MPTTKIDGRDIPIKHGQMTTVAFSAGRGGPGEAGEWEFWTAWRRVDETRVKGYTARCLAEAEPGERFRRMKGQAGYESAWEFARNADYLRPSKVKDVESWFNKHKSDACFATSARINGATTRIVNENGRYSICPV
jgi:hypothetical protein